VERSPDRAELFGLMAGEIALANDFDTLPRDMAEALGAADPREPRASGEATKADEVNSWRSVRAKKVAGTPGLEARIERQRRLLELEVGLAALRKRRGLTQADLSETLDMTQANVSRIEHEDDVCLSTLANYVAGLGGILEIHAIFEDEDVPLTPARKAS
jgi:DNA-binding XRE family transcriptional regulator